MYPPKVLTSRLGIWSSRTPRTWLSSRSVHVGRSRRWNEEVTSSGVPSTYSWNSCARSIGVSARMIALPVSL